MTQDKLALLSCIKTLKQETLQTFRQLEAIEERILALEDHEQQPAQTKPRSDKWLTVAQICKELDISPSTFYGWLNADLLPEGFPFGPRSKRWKMSEIRAWREAKQNGEISVTEISKRRSRTSKIRRKEEFEVV